MKRALVYIVTFTTLSAMSLVGCTEKTEVRTESNTTPDTVVVPQSNPDKDVNVNVRTENATPPVVVEQKETTTSTTVDNANGTSTTTHTETSN